MKHLIIFFVALTLFISPTFGQKLAVKIEKIADHKISLENLDRVYANALNSDLKLAIFKSEKEQAKFLNAYKLMLKDIGIYLYRNGFQWGKSTRCFSKVYFGKDGTIDYYFYHFDPNDISIEKEQEFNRLLNKFIQGYRLRLNANKRFSQQSPVEFNDINPKS